MATPRVFIIQEPTMRDTDGKFTSIMDFRRVLEYGDPVVCLPSGRVSLTPAPTIDRLRDILKDFTDDDYIVPTGDPSAMFIAAMIVGEMNCGRCKILKWDKTARRYIRVDVDLNFRRKRTED